MDRRSYESYLRYWTDIGPWASGDQRHAESAEYEGEIMGKLYAKYEVERLYEPSGAEFRW